MILLTMYKTSRTMITIAMLAITARAIVADLYASFEAGAVEEVSSKMKQTEKVKSVLCCRRYIPGSALYTSTEIRLKLIKNNSIKHGEEF